jgi:phage regulator Rha-like protein
VLRAVDKLCCSDGYRLRNFAETVTLRPNPSGGKPIASRDVQMTKDGFGLIMGFTGGKGAAIKEAYIEAFDSMAEQPQQRDLLGCGSACRN